VADVLEQGAHARLSSNILPLDEIEIIPAKGPLSASVEVPGSKSVTNRTMLLAAMAPGHSVIESAGLSDDTRYMAAALKALGFAVAVDEVGHRIAVDGTGGTITVQAADLYVGGAGTAMRFLAGFVTLGRGRFRLDGNQRMRERPMGALLDTMRGLGVNAVSERDNRCPPIVIDTTGAPFEGGAAAIDASLSSQFVSALLMPAPLWPMGLKLAVKGDAARPFIAMTLRLMERWGAKSSIDGDTITVPGRQSYRPMNFQVEPDASGASYFAAAAALVGGAVSIRGLTRDSVQGDVDFLRLLERMGAHIRWTADAVEVSGGGHLDGIDVAMNGMPDMVATLAALAPFASTPTRIRNVAFIRHHESDRLLAIATELRRLNVTVREFDDGLEIQPAAPRAAAIETYDDHRIAMAFAVIGLRLAGMRIKNPGCVSKTYPKFFDDLSALR
jgi:3-phosphoshikimate 1-carboxyvinyltransferase